MNQDHNPAILLKEYPFNGYFAPFSGPITPAALAEILNGAAGGDIVDYLTLAEAMEETDLHYAGELSKRKTAVARLQVMVENGGRSDMDRRIADHVWQLVSQPEFKGLVKDLLDAIGKGYSVAEIIWSKGTDWMPARYVWRDPRFFQFSRIDGKQIRLRVDSDPYSGKPLPLYKFITHIHHGKSGLPIRGGVARLASWAWMCKSYTLKDWLAFGEVFGMPVRLGKYGASASKDDIHVLKTAVAGLGSDFAAVIPKSMQIDFVTTAHGQADSGALFEKLAEWLDDQVSKGILGQTASASGAPGGFGGGRLQAEVRNDIRDDDANLLAETITRDLVYPFVDLNYGPQSQYPTLTIKEIRKEDVRSLTDSLSKLVPLGLRVEKRVVYERLGLRPPAVGKDYLGLP